MNATGQGGGPATRPNILLICVDQWRGDCLSAAGHPYVQTPHLDQVAGTGTRFRRGYSATPTCVPARVALFTGQSQQAHGRVGYREGVPFAQAHPVTMPGEFRRHGYQTQAIGKMHVYPERSRIGFDDVVLHDGYLHFARGQHRRNFEFFDDYVPWLRQQAGASAVADYTDNGLNCNSLVARPWDKPEALHPTTWTVTQAQQWLYRRDPTRPFFLYVSFHRPHPPYDPPRWAFEQYLDLPSYEPVVGDWVDHYAPHRRDNIHDAFVGQMDPRLVHRARAGYYGHMAHIDQQINRLLETLGEFGLADDTAVCFVSDHGEMMGDHRMFRKGFPYEGSAAIPFLLRPAASDRQYERGQVRDEVVELRDVMPTLLDYAGLPVPETVDGRSLVPLLRGENVPWRDWLHGEHTLLGQSLQWLTDGREKYCWLSGAGHEQLFDLVADPRETRNLADSAEHAERLALWRSRLVAALANREEGYVLDGRLCPGRTPATVLTATPAGSAVGA